MNFCWPKSNRKRIKPDIQGLPSNAYAAELSPPNLFDVEGRVVVKVLSSDNVGLVLQTIGRVNRGDVSTVYSFEEIALGNGSSGQLRTAANRFTGKRYAVKTFVKASASKEKVNLLRNEAQVLLKVDHPHIARLIEVWEDSTAVHFILEYCPGGDLLVWRANRSRSGLEYTSADEMIVRMMMNQVIRTLYYLHTSHVVHRDIKPDHWLIDGPWKPISGDDSMSVPFIKLIDFGLARSFTSESRPMRATCGTLPYMAPEVLLGSYTTQCDLWAAGALAYFLLAGVPPFYGSEEEITRAILSKEKIKWPRATYRRLSPNCRDFVERLLTFNPAERLTAQQAMAHDWMPVRPVYLKPSIISSSIMSSSQIERLTQSLADMRESSFFRKVVVSLMAFGLNSDDIKEVRELYLFLDKEGNGVLRLDDVRQFLNDVDPGLTSEACNGIARSLDIFRRGGIHFNDFIACCLGGYLAIEKHLMQATFWKFDRRRVGQVSVENMRELFGALYNDRLLEKFLREADRDGDKYIDYGEFEWIVRSRK